MITQTLAINGELIRLTATETTPGNVDIALLPQSTPIHRGMLTALNHACDSWAFNLNPSTAPVDFKYKVNIQNEGVMISLYNCNPDALDGNLPALSEEIRATFAASGITNYVSAAAATAGSAGQPPGGRVGWDGVDERPEDDFAGVR